jgi:hypothetical protein
MNQGFKRHDKELAGLREDMNKGLSLLTGIFRLWGAKWGLSAEESFRSGIKGLVEKYFGGKVGRWTHYDEDGIVFGHPSVVEADLIIKIRNTYSLRSNRAPQRQTYSNYGESDSSTKGSDP